MRTLLKFLAPLCVAAALALQPISAARADVFIRIAPPILPIYVLPRIPGPDYIWSPGYWAYDDDVDDYYWVPGTWVLAPRPGFLWTPGYWAFDDGGYRWHAGYWGPHVGFYGGINYGFGYGGYGYEGGRWDNGHFFYNTNVYRVDRTIIRNTYVKNVTVINNVTKVSFNGGTGGTTAKPNAAEVKAASESHVEQTPVQSQHQAAAKSDTSLFVKANKGKPPVAATEKAGSFSGKGVVASKGAKPLTSDKTTKNTPPIGETKGESGASSTGKHHDGDTTKSNTGLPHKSSKPSSSASTSPSTGGGPSGTSSGPVTGHKDTTVHKDTKALKPVSKPSINPSASVGGNGAPPVKSAGPKTGGPPKITQHTPVNANKVNVPHAQGKPQKTPPAHKEPNKKPDQN